MLAGRSFLFIFQTLFMDVRGPETGEE